MTFCGEIRYTFAGLKKYAVMNIIIVGDGEVGFHLAKLLSDGTQNITIVDPHEDLLKRIEDQSDLLTIVGDSTSPSVLRQAHVKDADLVISVLHDEKVNIITAALAKKLGAKRTIARVDNIEYLTDESREMFKDFGIDTLVCPERIASKEIVKLLDQPAATEVFEFSGGKLILFLIKLDNKAKVIGKSLDTVARENNQLAFRAIAIHRESRTIMPRGNDVFMEGDLAYVITKPEGIDQLLDLAGKEKTPVNSVMIVGGGRIGRKTASLIEDSKNVKIIESDRERCVFLSEMLNKTMIINGDARSFDLMEEEGIRHTDAFLALTNDSEINILTCLMARNYGVKRTIALVENIDYIDISQKIGIDTIINKKLTTASYIVRFTLGEGVLSSKCLIGVDADAIEFTALPGSKVTTKPIRDLSFPKNAIIGGIIRGNQGYIAIGSFQIQPGDRVVVFTLPEAVKSISRLFI